jgi:hypothetical protein
MNGESVLDVESLVLLHEFDLGDAFAATRASVQVPPSISLMTMELWDGSIFR